MFGKWSVNRQGIEAAERLESAVKQRKIALLEQELNEARERIKTLETGGPVVGRYCQFCENAGMIGVVFGGNEAVICLKHVPCKHFQRRKE